MKALPKDITIGQKYGPAMKIQSQQEADEYFEILIQHTISWGETRERAEAIEKENLGYYAGYFDNETRERVERLFNCQHPIFGSTVKNGALSPERAFELGKKVAHNDGDEN